LAVEFAKWCTRNNGSPTLNTVGLAVLIVVPTVHFGVGSVLAIAAAALGRSLTAAVVASDLGQWSITFRYHAGIGSMDALLASRGLAHPGYPMLGLYMCGRCRRHRSGGRHQPRPIAKAVLVLYSS